MSLTPYKFDPKPTAGSDLFFFDWSDWCLATPGEAIDVGAITITASPAGLTVSEIVLNGFVVRCRISGGNPNTTYTVVCQVATTPGRRMDAADATLYITR